MQTRKPGFCPAFPFPADRLGLGGGPFSGAKTPYFFCGMGGSEHSQWSPQTKPQ
jgi:hypothetical protein